MHAANVPVLDKWYFFEYLQLAGYSDEGTVRKTTAFIRYNSRDCGYIFIHIHFFVYNRMHAGTDVAINRKNNGRADWLWGRICSNDIGAAYTL